MNNHVMNNCELTGGGKADKMRAYEKEKRKAGGSDRGRKKIEEE
jgi:hypothetical protein